MTELLIVAGVVIGTFLIVALVSNLIRGRY